MTDAAASPAPAPAPDPTAVIKSRSYVALLVLGAVLGVPVATVAYFFLDAVAESRPRSSPPSRRVSGSRESHCGGRCHGWH